jgi:NAD(P)-dependent dehydrogenase (short-subunit alcohol dehydrogenase family)
VVPVGGLVSSNARRVLLITGGAGFIGSHIADLLAADGHSVCC